MLVYKKGALKEQVYRKSDKLLYQLFHPESGLIIETQITNDDVKDPKDRTYLVLKEEDGLYVIYEEFKVKNKTEVQTFKEAIEFFEDKIYEQLNETKPSPTPPNDDSDDDNEPDTFNEVPIIGDIVQVGNQFGRVIDVDADTKDVVVNKLTKKEAMRILKNQRNQKLEDASTQQSNTPSNLDDDGVEDVINALLGDGDIKDIVGNANIVMEEGGDLSNQAKFNVDSDNVQILRVNAPSDNKPQDPQDQERPEPPEEMPKNIKDPFADDDSESDDDRDGDDRDGDDKDGDDRDGDDKDGDDRDGDDKEGDDKDGDDKDGDDKDGDDKDGDDKDGDDKDGDDKDRKDGLKSGGDDDDDFGDDDDDLFGDGDIDDDLSDLISDVENQLRSEQDDLKRLIQNDIQEIELYLNAPQQQIKEQFKTKTRTRSALGNKQLFPTDNEERINNALNKIFE